MKHGVRFYGVALSIVLLAGCQDAVMRDKVTIGKPVIMRDADGNYYAVEHHIGNTYTVKPVKGW